MKSSDYSRIEEAIRFLNDNAESQPGLADLAGFLGLSEFHCHRLFRKWAGITPKDFLQAITLSKAKALLSASRSVLDTSLEVGLSGSSRLHDLFVRHEAMTPGQYKSGGAELEIRWDWLETPMGRVSVGMTGQGICSLHFSESAAESLRILEESWPNARLIRDARAMRPIATEIRSRMTGAAKGKRARLRLAVQGTPFQMKVWEALLRIPAGQVTTYRDLANFIGAPNAVRAVGSAVGANPIGYLIPCHRVIRSSGVIGDYRWGSPRKTALLAVEQGRSAYGHLEKQGECI